MLVFNPLQHQGEAGLVKFIDSLFAYAIAERASDIHIEPTATQLQIRLRVDGDLQMAAELPRHTQTIVVSRLKILAELDIAERRLPQDGKFSLPEQHIDCRLSTCPTIYGEKAVIRLLNANQRALALEELGMDATQQTLVNRVIQEPQGLILVTGPTGSGKTFTLYSLLNRLNRIESNIVTVEDPVEIRLAGVNQVNVQPKAGLDFAKILRAFLRQDPDIIMVGEIRDIETAQIALKAAQTGHLVLATLHTNSATQALTRLRDMGIPNYLLAHSIRLIISQRLMKRQNSVGRTGVFELLLIDDEVSQLILQQDYNGISQHENTPLPLDRL